MRETFNPNLKTKESKRKRRCCRWAKGTFNIFLTEEERQATDMMKKAFSFEKFIEIQNRLAELENIVGIKNEVEILKASPLTLIDGMDEEN